MKEIKFRVDEKEHALLQKAKGKDSWRKFFLASVLSLVRKEKK